MGLRKGRPEDFMIRDRHSNCQSGDRTASQGWLESLQAFLRRLGRHRAAVVAASVVLLYFAAGILAPLLAPYDPLAGDAAERLQGPSRAHLLGTDELGRDLLSRIIHGASTSLAIQGGAVTIGSVLGLILGLVSGYCGGWPDNLIMRLMDVLLAFPGVFLSIVVIAAIGPGTTGVTIAVGVALVPSFARLVRSCAIQIREFQYVEAAHAVGVRHARIITRHILPNSAPPIIVYTTIVLAYILLTASGLSYLGLGVQLPTPEWGAMLSNSRTYLLTAPHATVVPGVAIMIVALALNILGDALREVLDPHMRARL
jgi:peptide/nickel transport system permease protein